MTIRQVCAQRRRSQMTAGDVIRRAAYIRKQYFSGASSLLDLAAIHGLSHETVCAIVRTRTGAEAASPDNR